MKKIVYIILLLLVLPLSTQAYTFTRTLKVGSTGQDVLELQKYLNSNPATQVSESGVGSPGNESSYFGQKTKQAVIKLQNMFSEIILAPNNLKEGTGVVGSSTISFLNANQINTESAEDLMKEIKKIDKDFATSTLSIEDIVKAGKGTEQATTTFSLADIEKYIKNANKNNSIGTSSAEKILDELRKISDIPEGSSENQKSPHFTITKEVAKPDQKFYVGSQNVIKNVDFFLNSTKLEKGCRTDYTCTLRIDEDMRPGTYTLKSSKEKWGSYEFTVLNESTPRPKVFVQKLSLTDENIIRGENLSRNIKIYTMYGVFKSETANDSFILEFPEQYVQNAQLTKGLFYVENENGLTSGILNVTYEI